MKKFLSALLMCSMLFTMAGCGSDTNTSDASEGNTASAEETIDIDLSAFSNTMAYSELTNINSTPDDYIGQTIKVKGTFSIYHDEATDKYYYACLVADTSACCSASLEFVPEGDFTYPDDFPELNTEITVTGTLETYDENGTKFCHLVNAKMS